MMNPVAKNEQANKLGLSTIAIRVQILSAVSQTLFKLRPYLYFIFTTQLRFFPSWRIEGVLRRVFILF